MKKPLAAGRLPCDMNEPPYNPMKTPGRSAHTPSMAEVRLSPVRGILRPAAEWNRTLFLIGLVMLVCITQARAAEPEWQKTPVEVKGSETFRTQVESALKLIREKAPDAYELIRKNVAIISEGKRSGMWAYRNPPTYEMSAVTAMHSVTWCAGTIAHDAFHSKLYHDHARSKGRPVPPEAWTGVAAEKLCIAFQLEVLRKIGAPAAEIEHCRKLDGRHHDLNKDGRYDWNDYFKRGW